MSSKETILESAVRIAVERGVGEVTIGSVANAVGLTKAGLLHHFPNKDALLSAMLAYVGSRLMKQVSEYESQDPQAEGRWIRALLQVAMDKSGTEGMDDPVRLFKVMLTVALNNPKLMKPVHRQVRARTSEILSHSNGEAELLIWLAVDGLLLWQHLGILDPGDPLIQKLLKKLLTSLGVEGETKRPGLRLVSRKVPSGG